MASGDDMAEGFKALCLANGIGLGGEIRDLARLKELPCLRAVVNGPVCVDIAHSDGPGGPSFALFVSDRIGWRGWDAECPADFVETGPARMALSVISAWLKRNPGIIRGGAGTQA